MNNTISAPETEVKSSSRYAKVAAGLAVAAVAAMPKKASAAVNPPLTFAQIPGTGDTKVLNYALALEALEAEAYAQAYQRLTTGGNNNSLGLQINGLGLSTSEPDVRYLQLFGRVEVEHRNFLDTALGANSILRGAFSGVKFDFNINNLSRQQVVDLIYTLEQTGTTAYLGAIPSFATNTFLLAAGGIQATEARHTAVIAAVYNGLFGANSKTVAPLFNDNNGIDPLAAPDTVLATASQFIVLPA